MVGKTMKVSGIRQNFDLMVRVIRKPGDSMIFNAKADITIDVDDIMVVVGATKDIKQLERVLQ